MARNNTAQQEYIPDSSHAEEWLSEDVFIYRGWKYRILPDGEVIKLSKNGDKGQK